MLAEIDVFKMQNGARKHIATEQVQCNRKLAFYLLSLQDKNGGEDWFDILFNPFGTK